MIVVKAHTMTGKILKGSFRHIVEIDPEEPTAPYLYDCDVVITDYSTIMFDGYLLGKPAVLLEKRQGYLVTRGMMMAYPDAYSGRFSRNERDMLRLCRTADGLDAVERKCVKHVADACDGHACERVCALIRRLAESEDGGNP
jgi:CDP-glycerol glycerophosphotransferase (TagB/SpsB family)